jgi:HSP20 family protein|tara:strand:+ start:1039 stop:1455 length:417 start_codon:yes stop_codon:yes gene_type:complete
MSTLKINERNPFDILFRNFFNTEDQFAPAFNSKQPHPLNIYYNDEGLHFEVACTGLTKEDISISVEGDLLKISYQKPEEELDFSGYIYHGLSKKSFDLGYKISPKYNLSKINAEMENGLLKLHLPLSEESKTKSIKIK